MKQREDGPGVYGVGIEDELFVRKAWVMDTTRAFLLFYSIVPEAPSSLLFSTIERRSVGNLLCLLGTLHLFTVPAWADSNGPDYLALFRYGKTSPLGSGHFYSFVCVTSFASSRSISFTAVLVRQRDMYPLLYKMYVCPYICPATPQSCM